LEVGKKVKEEKKESDGRDKVIDELKTKIKEQDDRIAKIAVVSIFAGIYEGISQFTEKREGGVINAVINRQKGEEKEEK